MQYSIFDIVPDSIKNYIKLQLLRIRHRKAKVYSPYVNFNCKLDSNVRIGKEVIISRNVDIGKYTYINKGTRINNATIGNYCSISYNCLIGVAEHALDFISTSPEIYNQKNPHTGFKYWDENHSKVSIGNDVWVGAGVLIKQGINIGDGSVIAAGAVVTKDISPYTIVGGIPAKKIRKRLAKDKIEILENSNWWDMEKNELQKFIKDYTTKFNA